MYQWVKALSLSAALGVCASFASPGLAQTTSGGAASLEVDGVKLGMTPTQTIAALKVVDPTMVITDYTGDPKDNLGTSFWNSTFGTLAESRDYTQVAQLQNTAEHASSDCIQSASKAINGMPLSSSQIAQCNAEEQSADQKYASSLRTILNNPRFIFVWFSPVPGNLKAIAISSSTVFIKTVPTVANVLSALQKKYPDPPSGGGNGALSNALFVPQNDEGYAGSSIQALYWYYDPRGRIRSSNSVANIGITTITAANGNYGMYLGNNNIASLAYEGGPAISPTPPQPDVVLPKNVNEGNGVQLTAIVLGNADIDGASAWLGEPAAGVQNPLLAAIADTSLFDSEGVYKYSNEASSFLQNQQNQQNQGSASKFQGNAPNL